jgi:hypothetical protein
MSDVHWKESLEILVKKEAERALALRWAHDEAQRWTASWNTILQISIFIISTFSGAGAVGSETLLPFDGSATFVGVLSLIVSGLTTINNFLAFAKRSEAHRFASLSYGKLYQHLSLQLSLPRSERQEASKCVEMLASDLDKLSDVSPQLPKTIKELFHIKFPNITTAVPTILNGLECVEITPEQPEEIVRPKITIVPKVQTVKNQPVRISI